MNKQQTVLLLLLIILVFTVYRLFPTEYDNEAIIVKEISITNVMKYTRSLELNKEIEKLENKKEIIDLLEAHTKSRDIAKIILENAIEYEVPAALAFALAWSESRFDPEAINGVHNRNGSGDWGLFQLNDYHRNWSREEYLDPSLNTKEAMRVLSKILEENDPVMAIGIYNAGATGIKRGLPYTTLVHIDNIIEYRDYLLDQINEVVVR